MAHHDLVVDHVTEGQVAEELREKLVRLNIVLSFDLAFESVHFVELLGLVIATTHEKVLWEAHFPGEHEHDHLN